MTLRSQMFTKPTLKSVTADVCHLWSPLNTAAKPGFAASTIYVEEGTQLRSDTAPDP